jgi:DNA-binding LacI/PurR family transcriptional regulator
MVTPSKRLKIADIARLAAVSPATASRVLNGATSVRPEARDRVLTVVGRFGYRANQLARNLRHGRAEVVGVLVSDIENPHFAAMVRAIEDALYLRGKRVLLCNTSEDPEKQATYLDVMAAERVSGVLISPSDPDDNEISRVLDFGIPVVAFDREVADPRADAVTADNAEASARAVDLLAGAGHTRIGFVGGRAGVQTGDQRLAGYRRAMADRSLDAIDAPGDFTVEGGRSATGRLVDDAAGVSALVVGNNQMTIGALQALRERQLVVPDDIALVAFDDPVWATLVEPPLTALAQPVREMSMAAVDLLFSRLEGGRSQPQRLVFTFELRIRHSCGTSKN